MKKNNVMRVFSLLLALTLISVCAISGTFAKYVTKVEGQDHARVAKWGVVLTVDGENFADKYATHDDTYQGEYSVVASVEGQKVVAPGTNSADEGLGMSATVKGTPEVAARYSIEGTVTDVVLPAGTYTDYTELKKDDTTGKYAYGTFKNEKDYAPVKWNLVISGKGQSINVATALYDNLPAANLAQAEAYGLTRTGCSFFDAITIIQKVAGNSVYKQVVEAALANIVSGGSNFQLEADKDAGTFKLSYDFDPNKAMDYKFDLSWNWDFDDNGAGTYDKQDTYLGNVAAGVVADNNASTTIAATLTATAVQID